MIFRDVQLVNSGKHGEEKLAQNRYLMAYWDNLRDIFCTLLPNSVNLNGISKVNIYLGKFDGENYSEPSLDGIATFRRNDFNFEHFKSLSEQDKNKISLYYLEDSLLKICERFNVSEDVTDIIKNVSKEIVENEFKLKRIFKKATKWNKSRSLKAITEIHHKVGGIDVKFSIVNKQGEILASYRLMENAIWNTVWFEVFKSSWKETQFVIENRVGVVSYAFENSGVKVT